MYTSTDELIQEYEDVNVEFKQLYSVLSLTEAEQNLFFQIYT